MRSLIGKQSLFVINLIRGWRVVGRAASLPRHGLAPLASMRPVHRREAETAFQLLA